MTMMFETSERTDRSLGSTEKDSYRAIGLRAIRVKVCSDDHAFWTLINSSSISTLRNHLNSFFCSLTLFLSFFLSFLFFLSLSVYLTTICLFGLSGKCVCFFTWNL